MNTTRVRRCVPRAVGVLLVIASGCVAVDPSERLRSLPPAVLSVAVGPVADVERDGDPSGLTFTADGERFRELLLAALGPDDLDAASRVFAVKDKDEARDEHADLYLVPSLGGRAVFTHEGRSDLWWAAGGLWLVTWVGGLLVDDATYKADLKLVIDPWDMATENRLRRKTFESSLVEVSFLQRNPFFSFSTLQSLIIPPFWTSDHQASTSHELTLRATRSVATALAEYLKSDFEAVAADQVGTIAFPGDGEGAFRNGATVTEAVLKPTIVITSIRGVIQRVKIWVNGKAVKDLPQKEEGQLDNPEFVPMVTLEEQEIPGLRDGLNLIRLEAELKEEGERITRTVRVHRIPSR